jgi:hypothetical protein
MSLRLMRSAAWLTSDETAGLPWLEGVLVEDWYSGEEKKDRTPPLQNAPDKFKGLVMASLGRQLVVAGDGRDEMGNQAVDGIVDSVALCASHGCIV